MRSSLVVRASDCQCTSCNGPGFDPSICRHSGFWGAADETVLNTVRKKRRLFLPLNCQLEGQKSLGPLKISLEMAHKEICHKKNNLPHFQNQRYINSYYSLVFYSALLHRGAPQITQCRRLLGPNSGQLRLRHWLSDALATWLGTSSLGWRWPVASLPIKPINFIHNKYHLQFFIGPKS